jgi:PAS domain S-box-containing protein
MNSMRNWLRLPPPLRLTIPALVLAFNLFFVIVTAWTIIRRDQTREVERVQTQAARQANRLAETASIYLSGGGAVEARPDFFQHELSFLGTNTAVRVGMLVGSDKRVLQSADVKEVGRPLDQLVPAAAHAAVERVFAGGGPEQVVVGREAVVAIHALDTPPAGHKRAVIVLQRELKETLSLLNKKAVADVAIALAIMLVACIGLWLALKSYLTHRAKTLVAHSRSPSGAFTEDLTGGDEFAEFSRALNESEDRFRQLSTSIGDVFYMVEADWSRVLYVNPAYEDVWGRPVESLMQSPAGWVQSVDEADREDVMRHYESLRNGAASARLEYRIRRPDGSMRWIENRAFPVLNGQGRLYRIAGLARDVTGRKQLERDMLNATEQERRRMGRDLHDDLCQRLAAIKIKCELFTESIKRGDAPDVEKATELCEFIGQASALCRGVARTLVPVDLVGEGLMVAIDRLVKTMEALHEVPCFFHCPDSVMVESASAGVHLYRITQEFLSNAIRHGKPTRVDVRLETNADFVRVEVVNDGRPFTEPSPQGQGMGLKILHFRADAIGANMRIQPRSDGVQGTIATCLVPHASCNPDPPSKS